MAIIDSHCILFEGPLSAESTGKAVPLTALRLPGRMEPMPLRISVTKGFAKEQTTSLALTLQEADSAEGEWQDVPGITLTTPDRLSVLEILRHKQLVLLEGAVAPVQARFEK